MEDLFKHDYSGNCTPGKHYTGQQTFSVGIFQWVLKSSGKGLKKSAVKFRIKGSTNKPEKVYKQARILCVKMNNGLFPEKKSMTV